MTENAHDRQMFNAFLPTIGDGRMAGFMNPECRHSDKQS